MWNLQLMLCTALSCASGAAGLIRAFGYEGSDVTVSCPYDPGYERYQKYLCRNSCGYGDFLIKSSQENQTKYSVYDDKRARVVAVTISGLRLEDAGEYWCGVTRAGKDIYTEVKLEVKAEKGEQNARGEKNLEVLPPSITTEVHQHQSSMTGTPPASEGQDKVHHRQSTTTKTTTPLVSEELTEAHVSSAAGSIQVSGYEGGDVNVSCPYGRGFEGRQKYLCNNDCRYADVLITTSQGSSGKYSIHDDKTTRVFTVTISDLRPDDAGKYWCGVTRIGKDISIERKLEVKPDRCCNTVNKIQSTEEGSVTISCSYDSQSVDKLKFFCRGNRPSTCRQQAVITSSNTQNGRFRLSDDRKSRIFTVTISSLTLKDSGSYLCGVQRNSGFDVFSAVELEVKESCCAKSQNMSGVMEHSVTFLCPFAPQHPNDTMFLCKGDRASNCTDMMDQSRFILTNVSSSSFSVTVTKLEAGDAGTYWCGSGPEANVGNFTRFHLSVDATLHQLSDPAFFALLALAAGLLLMVTLVLVKVYKNKCHKKLKERKASR